MRDTDTEVYFNRDDLGRNLYRKKTYYTLLIEQEVLATNRTEAEDAFSNSGGIRHSAITKELAENRDGVETRLVDADYRDMDAVEYIGRVVYSDDEFAQENGDVEIDEYSDETTTQGDSMTMNETQILDYLEWTLDAIDAGDLPTAVDHIRRIRDHFEEKKEETMADEVDTFYADARDHHLINQDLNRALGKK
jgi:hypothetical protein